MDGRSIMQNVGAITEVSIRSNADYLERIRRIIGCVADQVGLDHKESYDTKLAVTEACANAIRHGSPDPQSDRITIRLSSNSGTFVAEVTDRGVGFDAAALRVPDAPQPGGYGIPLMKALTDEVEFLQNSDGTTVRLVKRARRPLRPRSRRAIR
jgi:serine/threonine-protein kinase RsbW